MASRPLSARSLQAIVGALAKALIRSQYARPTERLSAIGARREQLRTVEVHTLLRYQWLIRKEGDRGVTSWKNAEPGKEYGDSVAGYFVIRRVNDQYWFELRDETHRKILTSKSYDSKLAAEEGIGAVRANSRSDASYERRTLPTNQPYFVLKTWLGVVLGTSDMYPSASARETGIIACKVNGSAVQIKDEVR